MRTALLLLAAPLLAACGPHESGGGGSTGGAGGGSATSSTGASGGTGGGSAVGGTGGGSTTLATGAITLEETSYSFPARIDIQAIPGGYEALFTEQWGRPQLLDAVVKGGSLVLAGSLSLEKGTDGGCWPYWFETGNAWEEIIIPLGSDGIPTGTFKAKGVYYVGDPQGTITAEGSAGPDVTPPELKGIADDIHGPSEGVLLPWSPVIATLSEGMIADELVANLSVKANGSSTANAATWELSPLTTTVNGWAGATSVHGQLDWPAIAAGGAMTLSLSAGAKDPSGNAALGSDVAFQVLGVGGARSSHELDAVDADLARWGNVAAVLAPAAEHPYCDDTCFVLGPFGMADGAADHTGIAGLLSVGTGTKVRVRYRASTAAVDASSLDSAPIATILLVDESGGTTSMGLSVASGELASDGDRLVSGWKTADIALPASPTGVVGFAIHAGDRAETAWTTKDQCNEHFGNFEVYVDSVSVL